MQVKYVWHGYLLNVISEESCANESVIIRYPVHITRLIIKIFFEILKA